MLRDYKETTNTVLRRCRDDYGEIIVAEGDGIRSLYFGNVLQSSIQLDRPDILLEEYHQAMMSALLFREDFRAVLMIGLGGCSLIHFFLKVFPDCGIEVVELRRQVIDLAHDFFLLPKEDTRLTLFPAAGQDIVGWRETKRNHYDLIIVDAFDDAGPATSLLENEFLAACRLLLRRGGMFVMNLWNRPEDNFPSLYATLQEAFDGITLKLPLSEAYRNAIVFGSNESALFRDLPSYRPLARTLQRRYGINFPKFIRWLHWQNFF